MVLMIKLQYKFNDLYYAFSISHLFLSTIKVILKNDYGFKTKMHSDDLQKKTKNN